MLRKILIFIFLFFPLLFLQLNQNKKLLAKDIELNNPAIDFILPNIKGENYSLSQFRGRVILLNFWATWCSPCRIEIPILKKIYQTYKKSGFEIIAVNLDTDIDRLKNFLKENNINFLVLFDRRGIVAFKYKVEKIPSSFLIDKNQVIRKIYIGIIDEKDLIAELKKWLKK